MFQSLNQGMIILTPRSMTNLELVIGDQSLYWGVCTKVTKVKQRS
jgi:hypothetical protein